MQEIDPVITIISNENIYAIMTGDFNIDHYGFQTTPVKWFHSYLKDRSQYVDYDGTISKICPITTGVPQGSILGPLLLIIYMNDIHEASTNFKAILYADDTNLISPLCSFSNSASVKDMKMEEISVNINNELDSISEWLSINKLSLNSLRLSDAYMRQ